MEPEPINKPATPQEISIFELKHSTLLGVSVRAWMALTVTLTVCGMSIFSIKIEEPLYTLVGLMIGVYFGQNLKK